jgi:integrase
MDSKENQATHRLLKVRAENSKTGSSRTINSPVARRLERLEAAYKSIGMECQPHHLLFRNPTPARKESNIPYAQPAFTKRLENILKWSGIQEGIDKTNRKIVLYSSRHTFITWRLEHGVNIHMLSRQVGSSIYYIEQTYSHIETAKSTEELTKGMQFIKTLEEQD